MVITAPPLPIQFTLYRDARVIFFNVNLIVLLPCLKAFNLLYIAALGIKSNMSKMVYKALHGLAPTYFSKFISCCSPPCSTLVMLVSLSSHNRHFNVMSPPSRMASSSLCLSIIIHLSYLSLNIMSSEKYLLTLQSTLGLT